MLDKLSAIMPSGGAFPELHVQVLRSQHIASDELAAGFDDILYGDSKDDGHFLYITPPFMTNATCSSTLMSSRGSPGTAMMSAQ
jgi:hypothetical protein